MEIESRTGGGLDEHQALGTEAAQNGLLASKEWVEPMMKM
jgi:hypothetical protein